MNKETGQQQQQQQQHIVVLWGVLPVEPLASTSEHILWGSFLGTAPLNIRRNLGLWILREIFTITTTTTHNRLFSPRRRGGVVKMVTTFSFLAMLNS